MFSYGATVLNSIRTWVVLRFHEVAARGHRTPKGVPSSLWFAIYKHSTPPECEDSSELERVSCHNTFLQGVFLMSNTSAKIRSLLKNGEPL
jgi:hypothetical protein